MENQAKRNKARLDLFRRRFLQKKDPEAQKDHPSQLQFLQYKVPGAEIGTSTDQIAYTPRDRSEMNLVSSRDTELLNSKPDFAIEKHNLVLASHTAVMQPSGTQTQTGVFIETQNSVMKAKEQLSEMSHPARKSATHRSSNYFNTPNKRLYSGIIGKPKRATANESSNMQPAEWQQQMARQYQFNCSP